MEVDPTFAHLPVDFGSTLMCGSFGRTGRTASGCVFFMCRSMLPRSTYDLLHCGQWWFFSPVCERWCDTRCPLQIKSFGHISHRNGRSMGWPLVWLRWWNNRLPFSGKDFPHSSHWKGRSPVCDRLKKQSEAGRREESSASIKSELLLVSSSFKNFPSVTFSAPPTSCDLSDAPCEWRSCCIRCNSAGYRHYADACDCSSVPSGWTSCCNTRICAANLRYAVYPFNVSQGKMKWK